MNGLLYIIVITCLIGWMIGFYLFNAGELIHVLLVMSIGLVVFKMYQEEKIFK